jgi:hypothetical protein
VSLGLRRDLGFPCLLLAVLLLQHQRAGPYGVEDSVGVFGPGLVLLLLVVTPLVWSLSPSLIGRDRAGVRRCRGRRLRRLGSVARSGPSFWGIPGRVVERGEQLCRRGGVPRALRGLSQVLVAGACRPSIVSSGGFRMARVPSGS